MCYCLEQFRLRVNALLNYESLVKRNRENDHTRIGLLDEEAKDSCIAGRYICYIDLDA